MSIRLGLMKINYVPAVRLCQSTAMSKIWMIGGVDYGIIAACQAG